MAVPSTKVSIAVADRILLHLWEQDHQADHYLVSREVTRPGIAEICALHPPNVFSNDARFRIERIGQ